MDGFEVPEGKLLNIRTQLESSVAENAWGNACRVLLELTFSGRDAAWVKSRCLEALDAPNPDYANLGATCLGHLARIHGHLTQLDRVLGELRSARHLHVSTTQNALDDIRTFVSDDLG